VKLKDAATGWVLRPVDASKCVCGRGPAGELTTLSQTPALTGFGGGNRKDGTEKAMERIKTERKGREVRRGRGNGNWGVASLTLGG